MGIFLCNLTLPSFALLQSINGAALFANNAYRLPERVNRKMNGVPGWTGAQFPAGLVFGSAFMATLIVYVFARSVEKTDRRRFWLTTLLDESLKVVTKQAQSAMAESAKKSTKIKKLEGMASAIDI